MVSGLGLNREWYGLIFVFERSLPHRMKGRDCLSKVVYEYCMRLNISIIYFSYIKELLKNTFKIISWMIRFLSLLLGTFSTKWKNLATLLVILCIILSLNLLALSLESSNTQHWCWPENFMPTCVFLIFPLDFPI